MQNVFKLKGKKDERGGFKYYIRRSMPEGHCALRDKHADDIRKYKTHNNEIEDESQCTVFHFTGTNFVVDGKIIEDDISPPTFLDMMNIAESNEKAMMNLDLYATNPKEVCKSTFPSLCH